MTERSNYYTNNQEPLSLSSEKTTANLGSHGRSRELSDSLRSDESIEYVYSKVEDLCARLSALEKDPPVEDIRNTIGSIDTTKLFDKIYDSDKIVVAMIGALQNNDTLDKKDISKYLGAISSWWTIRSASKKFETLEKFDALSRAA